MEKKEMRILIINGVNLNMLGKREPSLYGNETLESILEKLRKEYENRAEIEAIQTNTEHGIVDAIQQSSHDGIVLNAGAYTHYSYAIHDAIKSVPTPVIEVHLTNVYDREDIRHKSAIASACKGSISGFGSLSYSLAIEAHLRR